jgi:hypothetical protein
MAREDEINPAGAAPLKGLSQALAAMLRQRADDFIAKDEGPIDQTMRATAAIARAALAVHALQAAEDKAAARALDAKARRVAAAVRAGAPTFDEGDETDMNEPDPRLGTAEGVAEIYEDARRGVERVFRHLEIKRGNQDAGGAPDGAGPVQKLDHQGGRGAAAAH